MTMQGGDHQVALRSRSSLMSDAFTMMFSGAYTVGTTLTVATYYVMRDKHLLRKLQQELEVAWPDSAKPCPSQTVLAKLPYLVCFSFFCSK